MATSHLDKVKTPQHDGTPRSRGPWTGATLVDRQGRLYRPVSPRPACGEYVVQSYDQLVWDRPSLIAQVGRSDRAVALLAAAKLHLALASLLVFQIQ